MEDDGDVDFEGNPADRKYYVHFNSAPTEILISYMSQIFLFLKKGLVSQY